MKEIKLYIGIPCYNNSISVPTFHSLHKLSKFFYKEKIEFNIFTLGQESLIPRGRNFLASKMYDDEENYTHLLFKGLRGDFFNLPKKTPPWALLYPPIFYGKYLLYPWSILRRNQTVYLLQNLY